MKTTKNIIIIAAIIISTVANATVRTLNNNHPSPGQYQLWTAVEAASSPGDTVYVSGSPYSYGDITVTKYNIMIMGTGHNPQKQNPLVSMFGDIEGNTFVSQFRVEGIKCNHIALNVATGTAQLRVSNCYVKRIGCYTMSNGFDCYLYLNNNILYGESYGGSRTPIICSVKSGSIRGDISNNIIGGTLFFYDNTSGTYIPASVDECDMKNNIFISGNYGTDKLFEWDNDYDNSLFSNNILINYKSFGISYTPLPVDATVLCQNNLLFDSGFPLPNSSGNHLADPLFVSYPCPNWNCYFSYDYDFRLQTSSPGHNAGTDGTDIGPYGGPYGSTFTTYGEPHIPQIKQMNMPATVVSGSNFSVNIISTVK